MVRRLQPHHDQSNHFSVQRAPSHGSHHLNQNPIHSTPHTRNTSTQHQPSPPHTTPTAPPRTHSVHRHNLTSIHPPHNTPTSTHNTDHTTTTHTITVYNGSIPWLIFEGDAYYALEEAAEKGGALLLLYIYMIVIYRYIMYIYIILNTISASRVMRME
jgi:hypothetical protein